MSPPLPRWVQYCVVLGAAGSPLSAQSLAHGIELFTAHRYADARIELEKVRAADPQNAAIPYYLGRAAGFEGDNDEAIRQLEHAVDLAPQNGAYHAALGNAVGDQAPLASKLKMPFMARRARQEWERAVRLDSSLVDARLNLIRMYATLPGLLGGDIDKASSQERLLAALNPMRAAIGRGYLAQHKSDTLAERNAYEEAIALGPDSLAAYVALADMSVRLQRPTEARDALARYRAKHGADTWCDYYDGRLSITDGAQIAHAEQALATFLASPPADVYPKARSTAHYWLGQLAERRGDKRTARDEYAAALKENPRNNRARDAAAALK